MQLTQKQELLVTRYVQEVDRRLPSSVNERQREQSLARLKRQLYRDLDQLPHEAPSDEEVQNVLSRYGAPEEQAAALVPRPSAREYDGLKLATYNRVWLGVCAGLAPALGLDVWQVRAGAIVLGVLTGPIALSAYIILYAWLYNTGGRGGSPRVNTVLLMRRTGVTFLVSVLLYLLAEWSIRLINKAYDVALHEQLPDVGEWGWLYEWSPNMFFWALVLGMPLAVLSGLPMANAWDESLKRVVQALLALYAIGVAFGIASMLVGVILMAVEGIVL